MFRKSCCYYSYCNVTIFGLTTAVEGFRRNVLYLILESYEIFNHCISDFCEILQNLKVFCPIYVDLTFIFAIEGFLNIKVL